jgi:DNA-directed RNA polymerase specialized sigma24 family protein
MAEFAERGTKTSYGAVQTYMHRQRQKLQKKPARQRAGST